jgi:hypothetical protein
MIYARAISPTTARVTYSVVPAATGYQLYRTGSGAATLVSSVTVNPNLVLAYDPTAPKGPPPIMVPWGTGGVSGPPRSYMDLGRSPKATYTYSVVATYPDSGPYRAGNSAPAMVTMPPGLPPAGLTATTSLGTVTLRWDPAPDATGYTVFRDDTPITTQPVRAASYVDQGLKPGVYTYSVVSFYSSEGVGETQGELSPRPSVQVVLSGCVRP